jgi:hypothetical protein
MSRAVIHFPIMYAKKGPAGKNAGMADICWRVLAEKAAKVWGCPLDTPAG